jgi:hypothetical protein
MKAGTLNVEIQEDKVLWYDRKRILPFGLPWTFTKYTLTENALLIKKGVFKEIEDEVRLYRCVDVTLTQTMWEKILQMSLLPLLSFFKQERNMCVWQSELLRMELHLPKHCIC